MVKSFIFIRLITADRHINERSAIMLNAKQNIINTVQSMSNSDAQALWQYIAKEYVWANIPEEDPDDIDLMMLAEANTDPDCKTFVSEHEMLMELGLPNWDD